MPKKYAISIISVFAVLSAVLLFFLIRQQDAVAQSERKISRIQGSMEELMERSNEAIVVRRASEQLEEIAYQQKDISDIQRQEAVRQRQEADAQKVIAQKETERANVARAEAVDAFEQMEEQKKIADQKRLEAEEAQRKTDVLARLALGRSLASQALNINNAGNYELAHLMAFSGWTFILENDGDVYQSALYDSLNEISGASKEYPGHEGYIRDIYVVNGDADSLSFISVSNEGEVFLWTRTQGSIHYRPLMNDDKYDFRSVLYIPEMRGIIAVTYQGDAVIFSGENFRQTLIISTGIGKVLSIDRNGGALYITSRSGIYSWIPDVNGTRGVYTSKGVITSSYFVDERFYVAEDDGSVMEMDYSGKILTDIPRKGKSYITCISMNQYGLLAFGCIDGTVIFHAGKEGEERLLGHLSSVNSILWGEDGLVTASHDGTVRFWNYQDHSAGSILLYRSSSWIYSAILVEDDTTVISGGASSTVHSNMISPYIMASMIEDSLSREFTQSEWNYYIGEVAPYRTFKE